MSLRTTLSLLLSLLVLAVMPAGAAVLQYNDRTTWINASSGLTLIDFNSSSGGYSNGSGLTIGAVNFVGIGGQFSNFDLVVTNGEPFVGNPYLQGPFRSTSFSRIEINLPANVTSAGVDIAYQNLGVDTFQVVLSTGDTLTTVPTLNSYSQMAFFGVTSDTAFNQMIFYVQNNAGFNKIILDNFAYGDKTQQAAQAPEVASLILAGAGLLLFIAGRRRLSWAKAGLP
ncbi:MAG: hypothetical protein HYR60_03155 [Acidobacteria bacterium]|nr:hypothetical protein [Acidobacteriota bacterium]